MFEEEFENQISDQLKLNEDLAKYTTIGIGGPAKYFFQTNSVDDLKKTISLADNYNIKIFILGNGSNIIVSDQGFDGLVIKPNLKDFEIINNPQFLNLSQIKSRHQFVDQSENSKLDIPNSFSDQDEKIQIKAGSSWKLSELIGKLNQEKITGLEWFSGIPGSIGGAVYMNIHGGNYFFSDFIEEVEVLTKDLQTKVYKTKDINFDYDYSHFHESKEIILSITLNLYKGNLANAKNIITNWGVKKFQTQPIRSAGCTWKNLDKDTQEKLNLPTGSIGYIVDKILNLKGARKGDAIISEKHGAFIENLGNASFSDCLYLIELVEDKFQQKFNFSLKREIEILQ